MITLLPEIFCNGNFDDYIILNTTDDITGIITEKLCNLTSTNQQLDATKLFLEEIDLDKLVHVVSYSYLIYYINPCNSVSLFNFFIPFP